MKGNPIDWSRVNYAYRNRGIAELLDVQPETVSRARARHAPDWRSTRHNAPVPQTYLSAAHRCRQLIADLGQGAPTRATIADLRRALDALEGEREVQAAE